MICERCRLELPPGSVHVSPESCIAALLACRVCGGDGAISIHPRCLATAAAQRGAQAGLSVAERKIVDLVNGWIAGKGKPEPEPDPDRERRGRRGSGGQDPGRFEP